MASIQMVREKHFLYFLLEDGRKDVRYDLKNLQMERLYKFKKYGYDETEWRKIGSAYDYFKGCDIYQIKTEDRKFLSMLQKVRTLNHNCRSVSTFVSRFKDALIGEQYEDAGISYECQGTYSRWGSRQNKRIITKPLNFYNKHVIKLIKDSERKVTLNFEKAYIGQKELIDKIANIVVELKLEQEQLKYLFDEIEYGLDNFRRLINDFNYDIKSLLSYLFNYLYPFENVTFRRGLNELVDYYSMGQQMGRNTKKYPKYLRSMHDIFSANFKAFKKEYNEQMFMEKMRKDLEHEDKEFCVMVPVSTKDVVSEGTSLNHCVSSYVDRIIEGETYIAFLRRLEEKNKSLVTLEIKENKLVTAKGSYNRPITQEENEYLLKFCKEKQLEMAI